MKKFEYSKKEIQLSFKYLKSGEFDKVICPLRVLRNADPKRFEKCSKDIYFMNHHKNPSFDNKKKSK